MHHSKANGRLDIWACKEAAGSEGPGRWGQAGVGMLQANNRHGRMEEDPGAAAVAPHTNSYKPGVAGVHAQTLALSYQRVTGSANRRAYIICMG